MKSWKEQRKSHLIFLRKRLALAFGDFDVEEKVREELVQAIRACDESRIEKIELSMYTSEEIRRVLEKYDAYQYVLNAIEDRIAKIQAGLRELLPKKAARVAKEAIFAALLEGAYSVSLPMLSCEHRRMLRESDLMKCVGLDVDELEVKHNENL